MLDVARFCKLRPTLYHLSAEGSWPGIQRHGLLSSKLILNRFGADHQRVLEIETHRLSRSYPLQSQEHGSFVLRDRTTLSHPELTHALQGSCSPGRWIDLLSQRVFFSAQRKSLDSLLQAPLNRKLSHVVLEVNTGRLFDNYGSAIEVADINTGYTKRQPAFRSPQTFQSPASYTRTGSRSIVEVTVLNSVPEILPLLRRAVLRRPNGTEELLYSGPI